MTILGFFISQLKKLAVVERLFWQLGYFGEGEVVAVVVVVVGKQ